MDKPSPSRVDRSMSAVRKIHPPYGNVDVIVGNGSVDLNSFDLSLLVSEGSVHSWCWCVYLLGGFSITLFLFVIWNFSLEKKFKKYRTQSFSSILLPVWPYLWLWLKLINIYSPNLTAKLVEKKKKSFIFSDRSSELKFSHLIIQFYNYISLFLCF